jgi:hypothetical protein
MKMGTTPSLWRYDVGAYDTPLLAENAKAYDYALRSVTAIRARTRLALFVAAGIEPLAAIPLCGSPWRQPRNPARHISPKALVLRAECLLERRFFDHHHPDMKKKPE